MGIKFSSYDPERYQLHITCDREDADLIREAMGHGFTTQLVRSIIAAIASNIRAGRQVKSPELITDTVTSNLFKQPHKQD